MTRTAASRWMVIGGVPVLLLGLAAMIIIMPLPWSVERATPPRAVRSGRASITEVKAFDALFPGADHFISYFTGDAGTPTWNTKALLHDRYIVTMQFEIAIDRRTSKVTASEKPAITLVEVRSVTQLPGGRYSVTYGDDQRSSLSIDDLTESIEDPDAAPRILGFPLRRGEPVEHIEKVWRSG